MFTFPVCISSVSSGDSASKHIYFKGDKLVVRTSNKEVVSDKHNRGSEITRMSSASWTVFRITKDNKVTIISSSRKKGKRGLKWYNVTHDSPTFGYPILTRMVIYDWLVHRLSLRGISVPMPSTCGVFGNGVNLDNTIRQINFGVTNLVVQANSSVYKDWTAFSKQMNRRKTAKGRVKYATGHTSKWARKTVTKLYHSTKLKDKLLLLTLFSLKGLGIDKMRTTYEMLKDRDIKDIRNDHWVQVMQLDIMAPQHIARALELICRDDSLSHLMDTRDAFRQALWFKEECDNPSYLDRWMRTNNMERLHNEVSRDYRRSVDRVRMEKELPLPVIADKEGLVIDGLELAFPRKGEDLFNLGESLDNCVSSYIDKVACGDASIAALLCKETSEPKVCIELGDNGFIQFSGRFNQPMPGDLEKTWHTVIFG